MKKNIWKQLINEFIKTFQLFLSKIRNSYFYLKTMEDFSKVEGIKTKGGKPYVQNKELMKEIVKTFIETPFTNIDRYIIRNNKIKDLEND